MYIEMNRLAELDELRERLITALISGCNSLSEGTVMTMGPPPYRRIDCSGRAVAYIRSRPRKRAVRADISGLWVICPAASQRADSIMIRSATGGATLMLTENADIELAIDLIISSVNYTHLLEAEYEARKQPIVFQDSEAEAA